MSQAAIDGNHGSGRYPAASLVDFCAALYRAYGMREDIAAVSARLLVEGDLLDTARTAWPCCRTT